MFGFTIGYILGALTGMILMSCMVIASETDEPLEDEWLEEMMEENERKQCE